MSALVQFSRLERLFRVLWKQKDALERMIFVKRRTQIPLFDNDSSQPHKKVLYEYTELSLDVAIKTYEEEKQASDLGQLLPCGADAILVRDSYKDSYDLLETYLTKPPRTIKRVIDAEGNITREEIFGVRSKTSKALVISGHPGIGKTFSNSYILVRRLLDGKPTILQIAESDPRGICHHHVLLHDDGVIFIDNDNIHQHRHNWAILVLADQKPQGMVCNMNFHEWFVLTTSSPRRENYKELVKHYSAPMFYMAPWNWNEIAAAAMSIHLLPETRLAKLHDLYTKYGPVPRILLETFLTDSCDDINNAAVQRYDVALRIKITELLRDANAYIDNSFGTNDSHTILLMDLPLDDTYTTTCMEYENLAPTTFLRIATKYIGHLIGEAHGARASREAKILYDWSLGTTRTKGTAGSVFEMRIHSILQEGGSFSCSPLDSAAPGRPPSSPLRICLRKGDKTFTSAEGLGQLVRLKANARSVKPELCNIYLQPEKCNFTSRDSLAICRGPNNHITKIVFFQITVSQNHAVKAKGLDNVLENLPADAKKEAPVIVFIVPASELTGFKRQKIDLGGSVINKHLAEKWHQYVLSFDDDKLWAAR